LQPQFDNPDFMVGWQTAHDDVLETMAVVGIADGFKHGAPIPGNSTRKALGNTASNDQSANPGKVRGK
jgi:hypothetical protein